MHYRPLPRVPTDFQQPPSVAEITAFVTRLLGPEPIVSEAVEIGGGAFNNTFRLTATDGRKWILRVSPPSPHPLIFHVEHHLLRREHSLTPWLKAISPLMPRIIGTDFSHEICPRDVVLGEFVEGDNWDAVMPALTPAQNDALWRELASLLHRIHAAPAPHFGWTPPEQPYARWSDFVLGNIQGLLADCQRLDVPAKEARDWYAIAKRGAPHLDEIITPHVLHGDPWPKNVLIRRDQANGDPRIVALLDHERGGFGDPLNEWVFNGYDFPSAFWQAYGPRPSDDPAQIRAHVYRGTIAIQCLLESKRYPDVDIDTPRRQLMTSTQELRHLLAKP